MSSWILKIVPKSVRKMIFAAVDESIREYTSVQAIQNYAVVGANAAISAVKDKVDADVAKKWCNGCEKGSKALATIAKAVNPEGDGGMNITEAEGEEIVSNLKDACGSLVSQSMIDNIVDSAEKPIRKFLNID